jgi:hypothetical protein
MAVDDADMVGVVDAECINGLFIYLCLCITAGCTLGFGGGTGCVRRASIGEAVCCSGSGFTAIVVIIIYYHYHEYH